MRWDEFQYRGYRIPVDAIVILREVVLEKDMRNMYGRSRER